MGRLKMAKINKKFYLGEKEYSDGPIEDEILNIVKENKNFEKIIKKDNRWPIFYHLSHLRENLFNWYPFKKEANLLEIGAGCGALTGLFCDKVSNVTAVELTDKRSQIIYNRHKEKENLEIIVGNLNNIIFHEKFDYIILCGVLEYANQFTHTKNPFKDFLSKIKTHLKDDGVILLALENRLGLKYFAGCREDHLGDYFIGINNYPNIDSVKTFSKGELEKLIQESGFHDYKFYYPYPDYKFPNTIHSDELIERIPYTKEIPNYDQTRINLFNERSLNKTLANEKISKHFSNSFLVELKNNNFTRDEEIIFAKINADMKEEFRTKTIIKKNKNSTYVIKSPLHPKAKNHIINMHKQPPKYGAIKYLPNKLNNNYIIYDFIEYNPMTNEILGYLHSNDKKSFLNMVRRFYNSLKENSFESNTYHDENFSKIFGNKKTVEKLHCHNYSNIDLIFENIFLINQEFIAIDYEWSFNFPIPVEYTLYRTISNYTTNDLFQKITSVKEIFNVLGLKEDLIGVFGEWEKNFATYISHLENRIPNKKNHPNNLKNMEEIHTHKQKIKELNKTINQMSSSNSWKITKPLRKIGQIFKKKS